MPHGDRSPSHSLRNSSLISLLAGAQETRSKRWQWQVTGFSQGPRARLCYLKLNGRREGGPCSAPASPPSPPTCPPSFRRGRCYGLTKARSCAVMVGQATVGSCSPDLQPWYWVGTGGVPYFTREAKGSLHKPGFLSSLTVEDFGRATFLLFGEAGGSHVCEVPGT